MYYIALTFVFLLSRSKRSFYFKTHFECHTRSPDQRPSEIPRIRKVSKEGLKINMLRIFFSIDQIASSLDKPLLKYSYEFMSQESQSGNTTKIKYLAHGTRRRLCLVFQGAISLRSSRSKITNCGDW